MKKPDQTAPKPEDFPDPGSTNQLVTNPDTEQALDALFKETSATPPAAVEPAAPAPDAPKSDEPAPDAGKTAPDAPKPDAKPDEPAPDAGKTAPDAKKEPVPAPDAGKKAVDTSFVDQLLSPDAAKTPEAPADPFDSVKLRSDASPKTKETFEELKRVSREQLAAEKKAREELEAKYKGLEESAKKASELPEDVKKELEELRGFRATFDIERDPQFQQKFDARKAANYDTVYQTLTKYGLPETELAKLKGMSEADRVEAVTGLISKISAHDRLRVEAKLVENAGIDDERAKELAAARSKADQILKDRAAEAPRKQEEFYQQVSTHAKELAGQVDVFSRVDVPADAPPAEKARLEATNKNAEALQGLYVKLLADETPAGKAQAALGTVLAHAYAAQVKSLRSEVEKLTGELTAIKKASGVGGKGVPTSAPRATRPAPVSTLDTSASLDRLYAETMANGS